MLNHKYKEIKYSRKKRCFHIEELILRAGTRSTNWGEVRGMRGGEGEKRDIY
jgi:hypothetical protein